MAVLLSLRAKLVLVTCSLLIGFGLAVVIYLKVQFADHLTQELLKRGVSVARHLAAISAKGFIEGDTLYLDYLAKDHRQAEDDIVYIFMLSAQGDVLAHSYEDSYPAALVTVNPLQPDKSSSRVRVDMGDEGLVYDIAVPVLDGGPGSVHLGISAATVASSVNALILQLLAAVALLCLAAVAIALAASRQISRPIVRLTEAVKALGGGDRTLRLPVVAQNEVGQLTDAFNLMVEQLGQAEGRLSYQKQFLEALLDDIPVPVFYKDRQGLMLGCNRAYCEFRGRARAELVGRAAADIYAATEATIHSARDSDVFDNRQPVSYELEVRDAGEVCHQMIFHKAPFYAQDQELGGIVGVMIDVSVERQAEQFRREFVSTVAHEFQTPLATIIGFADLLQHGTLEKAQARDALGLIIGKAEALSRMVDELLDLSRVEAGRAIAVEPVLTDLRPVLTAALDNFRTSHASHKLAVTLPEYPIELHVDPDRLVQILDNLLSNAVKYSAQGSRIDFCAERGGQAFRFTVADQGIGMTAEQRTHLFEKFYRANPANTAPAGTGLGLYICKAIIDAHGGNIQVASAPGQGTRMTVSLPWPSPRAEAATAAETILPA